MDKTDNFNLLYLWTRLSLEPFSKSNWQSKDGLILTSFILLYLHSFIAWQFSIFLHNRLCLWGSVERGLIAHDSWVQKDVLFVGNERSPFVLHQFHYYQLYTLYTNCVFQIHTQLTIHFGSTPFAFKNRITLRKVKGKAIYPIRGGGNTSSDTSGMGSSLNYTIQNHYKSGWKDRLYIT